MNDATSFPPVKQRRLWPWLVAALVIVGVILSVLGIRNEARRVEEQRQFQMPAPPQ